MEDDLENEDAVARASLFKGITQLERDIITACHMEDKSSRQICEELNITKELFRSARESGVRKLAANARLLRKLRTK